MSGTDDLKYLLERLKSEAGPAAGPELPPEPAFRLRPGAPAGARLSEPVQAGPAEPARPAQPARPESPGPGRPAAANLVWSENKETMLFGMLVSAAVLLGGIAASLGWLVIVGAVSFALFSAATAAALFGYARNLRGAADGDDRAEMSARLEQLSRKVDGLLLRGGASQPSAFGESRSGNRDLERKVEELRMLVRTLAKAVEGQDK